MFHRWRMMVDAFPGSLVVLTRKPDPGRPWKYKPKDMDFPCIAVPESIHISNHIAWSKGLRRFVKTTTGKNIVHLFEDVSGLNVLTIMSASKGNSFIIVNDGGFPETTQRPSQKLRWNIVGKRCHGAMTPGETGKEYMQAWGFPPEKIYNSYLSHDVVKYSAYRNSPQFDTDRNSIRKELGLESTGILALCVSRLLDWKRIEDIAESFAHVSEQAQKRLFVLLIGDGSYTLPLKQLQNAKKIRFKWIPGISYGEVMKYYAASDFLVHPSEGDIWGLVVNESLSLGKPVICTDRIGASVLVKNGWNGFKIPIRSPKALSQAMETIILDDNLRQSMSQNALTIEKTWHSGLFIDELKRIINDLKLETLK